MFAMATSVKRGCTPRTSTRLTSFSPSSTPLGAVVSGRPAACGSRNYGLASDRHGELVEGDRQPQVHRRLDRQLVVPSPDVLDEGLPGDHDPGTAVLFESSHRAKPRLQPAVVGLDSVVGIPIGPVPGGRRYT